MGEAVSIDGFIQQEPAPPAAEVLWRDLVVVGVNFLHHLGSGSDEGRARAIVWTEHRERRALVHPK